MALVYLLNKTNEVYIIKIKKKTKKVILITLIIAFIILTINVLQIPEIIECERLTKEYAHEFKKGVSECWNGEVSYIKVISYTPTEADVYYIGEDAYSAYSCGKLAKFIKNQPGDDWTIKEDFEVWTTGGGTLHGVVMPYWWHDFPMWIYE